MTLVDRAAIIWTIIIVVIGVGIAGYGESIAMTSTTQSHERILEITKQPEKEIAKGLTLNALNLYDEIGESVFEQINTSNNFHDEDIYVFVLDKQGFRVAHGGNPELIGLQAPNYPNNPVRDIILDGADENGNWVQYQRALPDSHIVHTKHSYVIEHDGFIFGSGYYLEDKIASEKRSSAQYMVEQAIANYHAHGISAFSDFNSDSKFHDGEMYVFVVRMSDNVFVSHGTSPEIIGMKDTDFVDANGVNIGQLFADNVTAKGVWVQYQWENPVDNEIGQKSSWIKLYDGYLFGVGIYD